MLARRQRRTLFAIYFRAQVRPLKVILLIYLFLAVRPKCLVVILSQIHVLKQALLASVVYEMTHTAQEAYLKDEMTPKFLARCSKRGKDEGGRE